MALTLAQLLTPSTEAESLQTILDILDGFGFSATSWQSGGLARTLCQMVAKFHSDFTTERVTLAEGRYNDTATGGFLTLLSTSQWNNDRIPALTTQTNVLLSDPNSVGPYTITLGQLVGVDPGGNTYRNTTAGTILVGGTLTLQFDAEVAGSASVPTTIDLATPLAGITATVVTPIIRQGSDEETDDTLRVRNSTKWSTLAYAGPADAYISWALAADPHVTRAYVDDLNPRGPGTIDLYCAGATGGVDSSVPVNVSNYIEGAVDGIVRRPLGSNLQVFSATTTTVSIVATLYVSSSYSTATVKTNVQNAITTMMSLLPVGGSGGKVTLAALYSTAMQVSGVVNMNITTPSADVTVGATAVPVPSFSITALVAG
jgi:uncharacterized phage protein gp47/JayE